MPGVVHQWIPDPATRGLLDRIAAAGIPPMSELGPEAARQAMLDGRVNDVDPPPVAEVSEQTINGPGGGIALRIYRPRAASAGQLGALLYFHGGGFVIGGLGAPAPCDYRVLFFVQRVTQRLLVTLHALELNPRSRRGLADPPDRAAHRGLVVFDLG